MSNFLLLLVAVFLDPRGKLSTTFANNIDSSIAFAQPRKLEWLSFANTVKCRLQKQDTNMLHRGLKRSSRKRSFIAQSMPVKQYDLEEFDRIAAMSNDELESLVSKNPRDNIESNQVVTYSRKVFIPLTRLCRDKCHYCT